MPIMYCVLADSLAADITLHTWRIRRKKLETKHPGHEQGVTFNHAAPNEFATQLQCVSQILRNQTGTCARATRAQL